MIDLLLQYGPVVIASLGTVLWVGFRFEESERRHQKAIEVVLQELRRLAGEPEQKALPATPETDEALPLEEPAPLPVARALKP